VDSWNLQRKVNSNARTSLWDYRTSSVVVAPIIDHSDKVHLRGPVYLSHGLHGILICLPVRRSRVSHYYLHLIWP